MTPPPAVVTATGRDRLPPALTRRLHKALRLAVLYHLTSQTTCRIVLIDTPSSGPMRKQKELRNSM